MKNKIFILFLGIFLISFISAETIIAGECRSITFPNTDPVNWSVEGNSSDMEGFSFTKNGTNITYCFHPLYKPDNFTLTFYNYHYIEEHIPSGGSGGGGSGCKYKKNFDWNCSEWGECSDGIQTRICKEYNNCGNTYGKPNVTQNCLGKEPEEPDEPFRPLELAKKSWKYIINIILVILILFILCQMFKSIKNRKSKPKKRKK